MSLLFATMESCHKTKICDKSVPTTSIVTPIIHSQMNSPNNNEDNRQWLNNSRQFDFETIDFASMVDDKGVWKYANRINFDEGHLDSPKLLELDGQSSMSSKNSATTTLRNRPSIGSIQMPVSHATCFGQELGVHDPNVPVSESESCTRRLVRGASHGSLFLEDGMRQLSTEDLLLALENPRKIRASLKSLSTKDQFDAPCESTYQPKEYLSPRKCSTSPIASIFERSVTSHHKNTWNLQSTGRLNCKWFYGL